MKTAGLVLDFYDDRHGELLKQACPTPEAIPEAVKTAHFLSPEERGVLRDEAFALILHNEGQQLRKFACVDEGNTILSTLYFMKTASRLPEEAVQTAAVNLISFNQDFGLPIPPALTKLAGEKASPTSRKRDSKNQPYVGDEADWAQRTNLTSIRGGADSGRVIPTVNQMKTAAAKPQDGGTVLTDDSRAIPAEKVKDFEKMKKVSNLVDVSGSTVRPTMKKKVARITALGAEYSLDSYRDVQDAVAFFSESWTGMAPKARHEFAVKTAARADELGISTPEILDRYGATDYSPDVEAHLANRRAMAPQFTKVWNDLQEKRAMLEPEVFAQLLHEADELVGLQYEYGGAVYDPYYATFGGRSSHEKLAWAYEDPDGEKLTEKDLRAIPQDELAQTFQPDFVEAFGHNPTLIFDSMPADTKQVLARMAREA